jgi:xanthine dehydrogenase small subunit
MVFALHSTSMTSRTIHFLRRGQATALHDIPPDRTLLEVLREDLHCSGTKEGCGEGDCGACTVVLGERVAEPGQAPQLRLRAITSCIRLAHSVDGLAVWTVEDLAHDPHIARAAGHPLHPAQEAMVQCHGSQCGFCTPGFVMSLFGLYENRCQQRQGQALSRTQAQEALSGNLCRCTGYRPILDAAQQMDQLPAATLDRAAILQKLEQLARLQSQSETGFTYQSPTDLQELLQLRAAHPQAQLVAGCTDVGLWVTKQHRRFAQVLDVTRVTQLRRIEAQGGALHIGAAATLSDAFAALERYYPELHRFAARFAGLPVRNSGTLGGNVANGSPIGDSMPLLIALNAQVVLASVRGERSLPLENLYTGYRQNVMAADELLARISVPLHATQPTASGKDWQLLRAYKVSKRQDDDISAVCLVVRVAVQNGLVSEAAIGAGGVAATPVRATQAEDALRGQPWNAATVQAAAAALQAQFKPISDMRASGAYRSQLLASLMTRFWHESQGQGQGHIATTLEHITLEVQP